MKCYACGYEHTEGSIEPMAVYYQRGSKKGQVKKVENTWKNGLGDFPFRQITVVIKSEDFGFEEHERGTKTEELLICPKCFTVKCS